MPRNPECGSIQDAPSPPPACVGVAAGPAVSERRLWIGIDGVLERIKAGVELL